VTIDTSRWVKFGSTRNADFYEVEQDILAVVPNEGCIDDAETASASVSMQLDYLRTRGRRAGVVVFMDPILDQHASARNVYRDMPDPAFQCCFALVGGSMFGRAAGSIFLGLNPPKVPTRLFSTFDEAVSWTRAQMQQK
jgi:hypothetical protein